MVLWRRACRRYHFPAATWREMPHRPPHCLPASHPPEGRPQCYTDAACLSMHAPCRPDSVRA
jgi:hypothetical protein